MATFASIIKRAVGTLALIGVAAGATFGSVAHAGPGTPVIAAKVVQYATELQVSGSGFGAGDKVIVYAVNNDTHKVETSVITTASAPRVLCLLGKCFLLPGGTIYATTPPDYIHCGFAFVTVYAIDMKTLAHSNYVQATLGAGPC